MRFPEGNKDDTVLLRPPPRGKQGLPKPAKRYSLLTKSLCLGSVFAGSALALWWFILPERYTPAPKTEAALIGTMPCTTTVATFTEDQDIVVINFSSLLAQGKTLNRIAAFIEKAGLPHDHVLDDTALQTAIQTSGADEQTYYYGHDYQAQDLRRFFTQAAQQALPLTTQEVWLRQLLERMGWLHPYTNGALITLAATGAGLTPALRAVILRHEIAHGAFYTVPAYRTYTEQFWHDLPADDKAAFKEFLGSQGYDTHLEELMLNEMQAYLAFTPDTHFFNAQAINRSEGELEALRNAFVNTMPDFWLRTLATQALPTAQAATCPAPPL